MFFQYYWYYFYQHRFGGFSLALAVAALDVWGDDTMVSGHTKFAPDFGADLQSYPNMNRT